VRRRSHHRDFRKAIRSLSSFHGRRGRCWPTSHRATALAFRVRSISLAAGEGIETMLSLRCVLPTMPMAAALSANHLSAMSLSSSLRRLYIARDADAAGEVVQRTLTQRAKAAGIEAIALSPRLGDFNEDLHIFGLDALRAALRIQLAPEEWSGERAPRTLTLRLQKLRANSPCFPSGAPGSIPCERFPRVPKLLIIAHID
jgi:hypothetical protein